MRDMDGLAADDLERAAARIRELEAEVETERDSTAIVHRTSLEWQRRTAEAVARAEAAERERDALDRAVSFLSSVIKSGEPWTDECQRVVDAARATGAEPDG